MTFLKQSVSEGQDHVLVSILLGNSNRANLTNTF